MKSHSMGAGSWPTHLVWIQNWYTVFSWCTPAYLNTMSQFFIAGARPDAHGRREQEGEGQVGQPGEAALEGALAQGGGEVVVLARVVHVVRGPKKVAFVAGAMKAVVACRGRKFRYEKAVRREGRGLPKSTRRTSRRRWRACCCGAGSIGGRDKPYVSWMKR